MARRRRVRGRGSIEALPSGSFRARVRGRTRDGRRIDEKLTCPTRVDAERALAGLRKRVLDIEAGIIVHEEAITLAEWRDRARRRYGLAWRQQDTSLWKHFRPLWNVPLVELDALRLSGWMNKLTKKLAGNTCKSAEYLLKRIVNAALKARVIGRAPWGEGTLTLVRGSERSVGRALKGPEWERVREAAADLDAEGASDGTLWLRLCAQLYAGIRPVEMCRLTPSMLVDTPNGAAFEVPKAIVAKGGAPGLKPVPPTLAAELRAHIARCPGVDVTGLIFPVRGLNRRWRSRESRKTGASRDWMSQAELRHLRERSGVADFTPYKLRHMRLTQVAHVSPQLAQNLGGHRHHKTTQRYVHSGREHLDPALWDEGLLAAPDLESPTDPDGTDGPRAPVVPIERAHALKTAARAHAHRDSSGRALGAGSAPTTAPTDEPPLTREEVAPMLEALRAHGVDTVARAFVAANGPDVIDEETRLLAGWVLQQGVTAEETRLVISYIERVRAHDPEWVGAKWGPIQGEKVEITGA